MQIEKGRVGQFILFLGLISLVIFFTTDQAKHPQYELFFLGLVGVGWGIYLIWRDLKPPAESQRFRTLRKWRDKQGDKDQKK